MRTLSPPLLPDPVESVAVLRPMTLAFVKNRVEIPYATGRKPMPPGDIRESRPPARSRRRTRN